MTTSRHPWRQVLVFAFILAAIPIGCSVPDKSGGRSDAALSSQPKDIAAEQLGVYPGPFLDTNLNGYRDTIEEMTVYLFPGPGHPLIPMWEDGSLTFRLVAEDGRELVRWDYSADDVAKRRAVANVGRAFLFSLCTLDHGTDELGVSIASLEATFTPVTGTPLHSKSIPMIVYGNR
jgi:hypothetical protein